MPDKKTFEFESEEKYLKKTDDSLTGRNFRLAMDNGEEYELRFVTGEIVEWRAPGEPLRWEKYGCLKSDANTYFVAGILGSADCRTCVTLVLDEENSLVTMAVSKMGVYPLRPRLAAVEFIFGAIRRAECPLPVRRHGFTRELVGKKITWYYSTGFINTHIYPSERFCRIRPLQNGGAKPADDSRPRPKEMLYDEPTRFIKIKEGMYLISFIEDNMNRVDPARGGNNLMVLANTREGFDCGRTFSMNDRQEPEHGFFRAYGEFTVEDIPVEHEPTPYRV